MTENTLARELLCKMDSYWRTANYLSVGQIYLQHNPLLMLASHAQQKTLYSG